MSGLLQRKLKIRSQGPAGRVMVFQDGDDADGDVTSGYRFDGAFVAGAQRPGTTARADLEFVELQSLDHNYDNGKALKFAVKGRKAWLDNSAGTCRINPNDRVEFFAEAPTANGTVETTDWHLNAATPGDQVRLFYGFVEIVEPRSDGGFAVTCRDALSKSNDLIVRREFGANDLPKLCFNLSEDSPDWYYAYKKTDSGGSPVWGLGESGETAHRLTVAEILDVLQSEYEAELQNEDVLPPGVDLFDAADLALLTTRPGPIVLENVGFGQAVREVLKWAPDHRLVVDHQVGTWRIVPWGVALTADSATILNHVEAIDILPPGQPFESILRVTNANAAYFSATPGATGNRLRIYDVNDPSIHEEATIHSIAASGFGIGNKDLRLNETLSRTYPISSRVAPYHADTLPTLLQSIDDCPPNGVRLAKDLRDAYSAVQIVSIHQETEVRDELSTRLSAPRFKPAWQSGFEANWRLGDKDRLADLGKDLEGIHVYDIGDDATNDFLVVAYEESQHGAQHTDHEWVGCSVWVQTSEGADVRGNDVTFTVKASVHMADIGDGREGIKITLETPVGGFLAAAGTFGTTVAPESSEVDRIQITSDYRFATTTGNNKRWEVGRKYYFDVEDHIQDGTSGPHSITCSPPKVVVNDGTGTSRRVPTISSSLGYPALNWNTKGPWEYLGGGAIGASLIWRRKSVYLAEPAGGPCPGGTGYQSPETIQATAEITKNTVRVARYPGGSVHAGHAREAYNLTRQLDLTADDWTTDSQSADYEALAQKIWNAFQQAHQRGSIVLQGIREHGVWIDLAIRVQLATSRGTPDTTSAVAGFWGSVTGCSYDFAQDAVTLEFDNKEEFALLVESVYETLSIGLKARAKQADIRAQLAAQLAKCLAGSIGNNSPTNTCATTVRTPGGRPVGPPIKLTGKDNQSNNLVPTGDGVANVGPGGGSGGQYTTHGPIATETVFADLEGRRFRVDDVGAVRPGDSTDGEFTDAVAAAPNPVGLPQRTQRVSDGLAAMFGGLQMAHEADSPTWFRTGPGSTTTEIEVAAPLLVDDADHGGELFVLDYGDRLKRGVYAVASIAGNTIKLDAPIADDAGAPGEHVLCILVPKRKPRPDPADFTVTGSFGFKDPDGNWWVYEPDGATGAVYAADLNAGTNLLELNDTDPRTLTMTYGPSAGEPNVTVETVVSGPAWDFDEGDAAEIYAVGTLDLDEGSA